MHVLGSNIQWNGEGYMPVEQKSNQWFGSTVYSTGQDGVIVVGSLSYSIIYSTIFGLSCDIVISIKLSFLVAVIIKITILL